MSDKNLTSAGLAAVSTIVLWGILSSHHILLCTDDAKTVLNRGPVEHVLGTIAYFFGAGLCAWGVFRHTQKNLILIIPVFMGATKWAFHAFFLSIVGTWIIGVALVAVLHHLFWWGSDHYGVHHGRSPSPSSPSKTMVPTRRARSLRRQAQLQRASTPTKGSLVLVRERKVLQSTTDSFTMEKDGHGDHFLPLAHKALGGPIQGDHEVPRPRVRSRSRRAIANIAHSRYE